MAGRVRTLAGLSLPGLGLMILAGPGRAVTAPAVDAADPAPSADLLLFLAEFQDARGNDVDPIALAEQSGGDEAPKAKRPADSKAPTKEQREDRDEPRP